MTTKLRREMDNAMVLRGFAPRTREAYLACVTALARHYGRSPDGLDSAQIQSYLLHLIAEKKFAYASVNQAVCSFRFLFDAVLGHKTLALEIPMAKIPKRLPQILSREEVSLVLHTWKQDLGRHVHVHALMAGGALGMDSQWVAAKRGFLFPVKALSKVFRGKFVIALRAARQEGKLNEAQLAERPWRDLLARVHKHDWVVYAKEPLSGPTQVLDYLGRYTHRVAISNERIINIGADTVSVRVRDSAHGNRRRTLSVPAQTFIERFLLHVLPKGFKRIRHYGLIGPAHKAARLAAARAALDAPAPDPVVVESVEAFMRRIDQHQRMCCPHCGKGQFVTTATISAVPLPLLHLRGPP